ncbi:MAG: hypothetical protein IKC14_08030 [Kiritimatiellae bacterium]|nr:hypothetical protein [Kiritimatiellia bacterium]
MTRKALLPLLGFAVAFATASFAAEINYKNGAWTWEDGSWEGGVKPGPADTAVIPELPILKTRYDGGKMQSNGLGQDEEIQTLRFSDLYGIKVQGANFKLTLNSIVCDDMSPTPEDTAQIATNVVATTTLALKGEEAEFRVGANHVLRIDSTTLDKSDEGVSLVKTGPGTVLHTGQTWNPTNTFWVKEGVYIRSGAGYPEFHSDVIVGGAGKDAVLTVLPSANQALVLATSVIDVRAKGRLELPALGKYYYLETLKIDHGVIDGGGDTIFCMNNQGSTECGTEYAFDGGTISNGGIVVVYGGALAIKPSGRTSAIHGRMIFNTGYDVDVPDGAAPVDFLVTGSFEGANRGVNKAGDGTMTIRVGDAIQTWGGTAGRPFEVKGGTLSFESSESEGIGMGTNDVKVAAGATYAAVGRHVGAIVVNRGRIGKVILNGEAGKTTTFAIGKIDEMTGALNPGRYTVGTEEEPSEVVFNNDCTLKIGATAEGVSALVVNGTFTLSGNDTLSIVGPEDVHKIPAGDYAIVTTTEAMNRPFATVLYNGSPVAGSGLKVRQEANRIVLRVPRTGMTVIVR